jgi:flavin reductase (DIM6/NTAB) family NADH-FMN oxidoreductase RutF
MACVPNSVSIVSVKTHEGVMSCTISSLISVDVTNPQVLFVLKNDSQTLSKLRKSKRFSISVLSEHQRILSIKYSLPRDENDFINDSFFEGDHGIPIIKDSVVFFLCELEEILQLQNASVLFANVLSFTSDSMLKPLVYQNRKYFKLGEALD